MMHMWKWVAAMTPVRPASKRLTVFVLCLWDSDYIALSLQHQCAHTCDHVWMEASASMTVLQATLPSPAPAWQVSPADDARSVSYGRHHFLLCCAWHTLHSVHEYLSAWHEPGKIMSTCKKILTFTWPAKGTLRYFLNTCITFICSPQTLPD